MDLGLKGKAALVTGASEGIGAGIALALAREGASVAICARSREKLEETARGIGEETGAQVTAIVADLSAPEGCRHFVHAAHRALGRVDILVNNAGAARFGRFMEMPDEEFVDSFQGKMLATARCTREAVPFMREAGGGVILNITGATLHAVPLHGAGGSGNAAVRMFSKVLSLELAPYRIRVNSIAPGRIRTGRMQQMMAAEAGAKGIGVDEAIAQAVAGIPSARVGEVADIAQLVCFLASDHGAYINGAAINVDGGKSPLI